MTFLRGEYEKWAFERWTFVRSILDAERLSVWALDVHFGRWTDVWALERWAFERWTFGLRHSVTGHVPSFRRTDVRQIVATLKYTLYDLIFGGWSVWFWTLDVWTFGCSFCPFWTFRHSVTGRSVTRRCELGLWKWKKKKYGEIPYKKCHQARYKITGMTERPVNEASKRSALKRSALKRPNAQRSSAQRSNVQKKNSPLKNVIKILKLVESIEFFS